VKFHARLAAFQKQAILVVAPLDETRQIWSMSSLWTGDSAAILWFLAGLGLVLLEFVAPGVILVFLGLGAWATALALKAGWIESASQQAACFGLSSLVLLLSLRRLFKGWFAGFYESHDGRIRLDEFTGHEVRVLSAFGGRDRGQVEFKGANWQARAAEPEEGGFEAGEIVVIARVDGLCLVVRRP
jgi:membrane protein implicated in regulation of membrane protease activity